MAYQESGDKQRAKQYLLETLRLDPTDAWSHLLLGNIYSKQEKNYTEAEKHYQRAYELKPVDAILLTNYGAMRAEQGRLDEAGRYFEAIRKEAEKSYSRMREIVEEFKRALETQTGYGIDIQEDNSLDGISGITEIAWKHKRERHLIKYRMRSKPMTPHLLAHELTH